MLMLRLVVGISSLAWIVFGIAPVFAQNYPNRPIRIVGGAAGGGGDSIARQIAQAISGPLGQPVVIDNRASALVAAEIVAKTKPEGYDLVVTGNSHWVSPLLRKVPYDPVGDFAPITLVSRQVSIVAVHPSLPVKSIKELIALAKAKPGELNYSSSTPGTTAHLATELFKSMAGINVVHVPYKGGAAAITALISGEVHLIIFDAGILAPHLKLGKVKALAVTSAQPSTLAPGLPTVAASGVPGYESTGVTVILAVSKTPEAIISRLNQEIVRFLSRADTKERLFKVGEEVVWSSPEELAAIIKADTARMAKVIQDARIKIE